ncbi:MAG TPA: hypothetical protein VFP65_29170 [Anaeromyxobacteraceae bacterium]|nr:hypothetical protein [Anaeromyxobacteraceae bacterium]
MDDTQLAAATATAILGVDTLWGGDVLCASGTGRFIADSWFSDEPLPLAYRHPAAAPLRASGGLGANAPDAAAVDAYLAAVDVRGAIAELASAARSTRGLRAGYLDGLARALEVMWDLGQERLGRGAPVPFDRCVEASTGRPPEPSHPAEKRDQVASLLASAGFRVSGEGALLAAVEAWRIERLVPRKAIPALGAAFIAQLEAGTARHVAPHLPPSLRDVPRANIAFLPIEDAWFSGSMNYLGRERDERGAPSYEATYELNASLQISVPEFVELVSHEVVPGHCTTFALLQKLYVDRQVGFEATVLTMNTRAAALSEGIANNAVLMAHGVTRLEDLPDADLRIGMLLALLQDDAKNQAAWLTWCERRPQPEVAAALRRDFLVSEERAGKLSGTWARHPLNGRMYLPAYRAGTEKVADVLRRHPPARAVPALFGARGLVDVVTIDEALAA